MDTPLRITIPMKPISWNKLARKNRWLYMDTNNAWHGATFWALKQVDWKTRTDPQSVVITAHWKGKRRHDIDSLFAKAVLDGLVESGLLPDDSLEYVKEVTYRGELDCPRDELIVELCSWIPHKPLLSKETQKKKKS